MKLRGRHRRASGNAGMFDELAESIVRANVRDAEAEGVA